jgi:hypothetical protein
MKEHPVIPAKAGIQFVQPIALFEMNGASWIPACAGMTILEVCAKEFTDSVFSMFSVFSVA